MNPDHGRDVGLLIRDELEKALEPRRADDAFMARIKRSIIENKPILDRLAADSRPD